MKFMMLATEAEPQPSKELVAAIVKYGEDLARAGVLLASEGLHPSSGGTRITFSGGNPAVTEGPFNATDRPIGGFWLIQVRSKEEAVEYASRLPFTDGDVEIRQVFDLSDFPSAVLPPEHAERAGALRAKVLSDKAQGLAIS